MTPPAKQPTAWTSVYLAAKERVARLLCIAGVPALSRLRNRRRLAILMFHGIEPEPLSPTCWHVLDAASLRRQLEYVRRHFTVLPLHDALERMRAGTLPDRAAVLTFDDGTRNLALHAAPVLQELQLPAAVFLSTGPMGSDVTLWPDRLWLALANTSAAQVDLTDAGLRAYPLRTRTDRGTAYAHAVLRFKDFPDAERIERMDALMSTLGQADNTDPGPFRLLSWDEARALAADGLVSLYPHTVTHPILSRCSDEKVNREISDSCSTVERETGQAPVIFAYPNGRAQDFDERAKAVLRRNGVRWALSTSYGFADANSDPMALPRISIGSNLSWAGFRVLVSGLRR
ncbi:peptidoglycan/xylan/chitin deacetylase (PgdA/CDA1 family) [Mycobacterium frederiksbergense]|uniref:Peptidoglycan/xylan/chitin deacetylase (PgdA/CDA1 family) n=1 Tax=Mycolicibacterium frederiksbergense TaxID=117567 RepID=A0ABT6L1F1_9MYCO|nr:polysaccharide deacetylase family protein [Mycolicibacterium frederiksbergense]MDH6196783.1 peptidoglycan/xylan/chitin deacetylase (PgdA/CDA1 family) [Mycolicibacterium frederiksbergense]